MGVYMFISLDFWGWMKLVVFEFDEVSLIFGVVGCFRVFGVLN